MTAETRRHAWSEQVGSSTPVRPEPGAGGRTRPELFGVVEGSVMLVVRAIRDHGRLGAAEPVIRSAAGELVIVPADREGVIVEIRASHDAQWQAIQQDDRSLGDAGALDDAVRPFFEGPSEVHDWLASDESPKSWQGLVEALSTVVVARIDSVVTEAEHRLRDRLARLKVLDDESLTEVVHVMAAAREHSSIAVTSAANRSGEIAAALDVVEALGCSIAAAADAEFHDGSSAADQVARTLHLQYREVKLDGSWWRESAGPLLARRSADGVPVSLIPRRGGYEAFEHGDLGRRSLGRATPELAAGFEADAVMFYRPLPAGRVRVRDLLKLVAAGNAFDVLVVIGIMFATSGLVALVPILTGMIVGTVIPGVEVTQLVFIGSMLVSIAISRAIVHVLSGIAFLRIETRSSYQVIAALVDRILQLPASFFRASSAGDLTQRVMAVEQVRQSLTQSIMSVVMSLLASLSNLGVLLYFDVEMGLTAIGVIVVELAVVAWVSIRLARLDYEMSVAKGDLDGFGVDMLLGIRQIRVQGSRNRVLARLLSRLGRVGAFTYRSGLLGVWLGAVVGAASTVALAFVFVEFTASLRGASAGGPLDPGGFVAFVTALTAFLGAVVGIAPAIKAVANMVPQFHRIKPLLDAETEVAESGGDSIVLRGGVSARNIRFGYDPDLPPVLDGVDIDVRPGEFVALVGRTGCGKSTLLSLLLGLERPDSGQVLYDDIPLENLDAAVVRSQVGVVMQSNETLAGNVQSTILGIGSRRTIDDAWAAARLVGMGDEIDDMPMGMLTMITPNSMSQSQLQRLLIARALVSRPEVLYLDEATSALDNTAQAEITKAIDGLGSTRVVIAHRLSTIRNADRIYVLEKGRVVQSGTFDELEAEGGHFSELMAGQVS